MEWKPGYNIDRLLLSLQKSINEPDELQFCTHFRHGTDVWVHDKVSKWREKAAVGKENMYN